MGRKIVSKKHKGTKDPLSLRKQQFEKIKDKINEAPKNADLQEIPKKYLAFQMAEKKIKRQDKKTKKRLQKKKMLIANKKNNDNNVVPRKIKPKNVGMQKPENIFDKIELINSANLMEKNIGWYPKNGRPFKPIPTIQQHKNESDYVFHRRMKQITDAVIYESKYRDKFKCDVERNEAGDVVKISKIRDEKVVEKRRLKDKERRLKLKMKKNKNKNTAGQQQGDDDTLMDDIDERERQLFRREVIPFGEVVKEPPTLETEKLDKLLKGQKESKNYLFLQNLKKTVQDNAGAGAGAEISSSQKSKQELEEQREAAVLAYRQLKASKYRTR